MTADTTDRRFCAGRSRFSTACFYLAVFAITILAFHVRAFNWKRVFIAPGDIRLIENDAYYHMRRILLITSGNFTFSEVDPYMCYGSAFRVNTPPLFDYLVAGVAQLLAANRTPSDDLVTAVAAIMPAILGAMTVGIVIALGRALMSRCGGLLAGMLLTFMPYHIQVSVVGRPDHHVLVGLLAALLLLCLVKVVQGCSAARAVALAGAVGLLLVLLLLTWVGSLFFVIITCLSLGASMVVVMNEREIVRRHALLGCGAFMFAAVLLLPVLMMTAWWCDGIGSWTSLCRYHLDLLITCGAGLVLEGILLDSLSHRRHEEGRIRWHLLAFAGIGLIAGIVVWRSLVAVVAGGIAWFGKVDPFVDYVQEIGAPGFKNLVANFTWLVVPAPLLMLLLVKKRWRNMAGRRMAVVFVSWSAVCGVSAVMQQRFSDLFSISMAVLIAAFICLVFFAAQQLSVNAKARIGAWGLGLALLTICVWPTGKWVKEYAYAARQRHLNRDTVYELCRWMRDNTPATSGYKGWSLAAPEYSVLASWPLGNAITYIGERPNLANNFVGLEDTRESCMIPYRFFVSEDVAEAEKIIAACGARYIIVSEPIISGELAIILDVLGAKHSDFFASVDDENGFCFTTLPRAKNCMLVRLYLAGDEGFGPFKPVHESERATMLGGRRFPTFRVFEYVSAE